MYLEKGGVFKSYELESILCNKQKFYIYSLVLAFFCHTSSPAGAPLSLFLVSCPSPPLSLSLVSTFLVLVKNKLLKVLLILF